MAKVYAYLERAGMLETRRGVGTFVAARTESPEAAPLRRAGIDRVRRFLAGFRTGFSIEDALRSRSAGSEKAVTSARSMKRGCCRTAVVGNRSRLQKNARLNVVDGAV
jgi:DNA-binding transcriptional regulator YhcF (GntR family)